MKEIVSVSLGSSSRDHEVRVTWFNEPFHIRRIGMDGDLKKALAALEALDGTVDAIGLGGIDVYLYAGDKRYPLRDGVRLMDAVKKTPVVDGSGLKNSLERDVVAHINRFVMPLTGKKVLMVSALDRFGMAKAFWDHGTTMVFGDFIFALGLDKPIHTLTELEEYAEKLLPELGKLPIGFIYPIGKKQEEIPADSANFSRYYHDADIIAGDFHFIRKYLPARLEGKVIVTNTVTPGDIETFRERGVRLLVTTTPALNGRSFGTNVIEAALLAILGKKWDDVTPQDYTQLLRQLDLKPRILNLAEVSASA